MDAYPRTDRRCRGRSRMIGPPRLSSFDIVVPEIPGCWEGDEPLSPACRSHCTASRIVKAGERVGPGSERGIDPDIESIIGPPGPWSTSCSAQLFTESASTELDRGPGFAAEPRVFVPDPATCRPRRSDATREGERDRPASRPRTPRGACKSPSCRRTPRRGGMVRPGARPSRSRRRSAGASGRRGRPDGPYHPPRGCPGR